MDILKILKEFSNEFGINLYLLGAQVVNFLIVLFLLKKFLYKPVLELLKKRENTIKEGIEKAEEARMRLEKVVEEEKKILKLAQEQAKKIIDEAKHEAIGIARQIQEDSKKQTEKMIKDAYDQIAREGSATEKRLAVHVGKVAVSFLQKSLLGFFSEKEQKDVMQRAIKIIKKSN